MVVFSRLCLVSPRKNNEMSSFDLFLYAYVLAFDRISVRHEIATRVTMETNLAGGVVIQRIFMADVTYVT